ncbi:MAG: VWA domain-containing protein [Terriglobia bacterium]|jgi:VWFA-related protein
MSALRSFWRRSAHGLAAISLAIAATGQGPESASKQDQVIFRASTRLVQVDVIVHDKNGKPVPGLTRDDFTLWDGGKQEAISLFSVESSLTMSKPAPPTEPNVFSNRLESRAGVPTSVTVILWDGLNTEFEDQVYARQQVIKFLGQLQPQDRVALYALGMRLRVVHDFTSDASSLLSAMGQSGGRIASELAASRPEDMVKAVPTAQSEGSGSTANNTSRLTGALEEAQTDLMPGQSMMEAYYYQMRVEITLKAMEAIANHLAALPGRKNLVWISGSFPINLGLDSVSSHEKLEFSEQIERTVRAMARANVAIYPVDARGFMTYTVFKGEKANPVAQTGGPGFAAALAAEDYARQQTFATMQVLADRTGGRAFYDTNDLKTAIRSAVDDSSLTYNLGYYPTHNQWNGSFRPIKVQVKGKGLQVRYRLGYFASPQEPIDEHRREALLKDTEWSPLEATGIGLRVKVARSATINRDQLWLMVLVDPHDVTFSHDKDRWAAEFEVILMQRDADGNTVGGETKKFTLDLTPESYQKVVQAGLSVRLKQTLKPETTEMRVAAFDAPSGAIGFVSIPLQKVAAR